MHKLTEQNASISLIPSCLLGSLQWHIYLLNEWNTYVLCAVREQNKIWTNTGAWKTWCIIICIATINMKIDEWIIVHPCFISIKNPKVTHILSLTNLLVKENMKYFSSALWTMDKNCLWHAEGNTMKFNCKICMLYEKLTGYFYLQKLRWWNQ